MIIAHRLTLPNPVRAVIFDMDGTLLDTEAVHQRAMTAAGVAVGWAMPAELLLAMVGIHRDGTHALVRAHFGPDFPIAAYFAESDRLFEAAIAKGVAMRPGAEAVLAQIACAKIPMAVATSTRSPLAQARLARAGILPYFETVVTRNDVTQAKPHPEPYLLAAARMGVDPADCVAVEDSPAGVLSASAAGMATVMVPDLLPPTEALRTVAVAVVPGLADLGALLFGDPHPISVT